MEAAQEARVPRVDVQNAQPVFQRYSCAWALHPDVVQRGHDLHTEKPAQQPHWHAARNLVAPARRGNDGDRWLHDPTCGDAAARQAVHRSFEVEFLSDPTGTLLLDSAGALQRAILAAQ